jgi:hypothetical protein
MIARPTEPSRSVAPTTAIRSGANNPDSVPIGYVFSDVDVKSGRGSSGADPTHRRNIHGFYAPDP